MFPFTGRFWTPSLPLCPLCLHIQPWPLSVGYSPFFLLPAKIRHIPTCPQSAGWDRHPTPGMCPLKCLFFLGWFLKLKRVLCLYQTIRHRLRHSHRLRIRWGLVLPIARVLSWQPFEGLLCRRASTHPNNSGASASVKHFLRQFLSATAPPSMTIVTPPPGHLGKQGQVGLRPGVATLAHF